MRTKQKGPSHPGGDPMDIGAFGKGKQSKGKHGRGKGKGKQGQQGQQGQGTARTGRGSGFDGMLELGKQGHLSTAGARMTEVKENTRRSRRTLDNLDFEEIRGRKQ